MRCFVGVNCIVDPHFVVLLFVSGDILYFLVLRTIRSEWPRPLLTAQVTFVATDADPLQDTDNCELVNTTYQCWRPLGSSDRF